MKPPTRLTHIDNLRAVCLVLMVLGHCGLTLEEKNVIYSFHMPIFYFLAGLLYHGTKNAPVRYFLHKAKRLLLPYAAFVLIVYIVSFLILGKKGGGEALANAFLYGTGIQGGGGALWFLPSLFATYVLAALRHKLHINAAVCLIICMGEWYFLNENHYLLWFGFGTSGLFFFTLGEIWNARSPRINEWLESKHKTLRTVLFLISLLAVYAFAMHWGGYPRNAVFNIKYMVSNPGMLLAAIAACILLIEAFARIHMPQWFNSVCSKISLHAIAIIGTHLLPILIFKHYSLARHMSHYAYISLLMLAEAVWLPIASYIIASFLPWLEGNWYKTNSHQQA